MIEIVPGLVLEAGDFVFKYTRSSGPGGQNVNKVNTRVTLFFDIKNCEKLSGWQKRQIYKKFTTRIDKNGVLRIICQKHRTQKANRKTAIERLAELLRRALKRKPVRKKTKVPKRAIEKRISDKKHRSRLKQQRSKNPKED